MPRRVYRDPTEHDDRYTDLQRELTLRLMRVDWPSGRAQRRAFDAERMGNVRRGVGVPHAHPNVVPHMHPNDTVSARFSANATGIPVRDPAIPIPSRTQLDADAARLRGDAGPASSSL